MRVAAWVRVRRPELPSVRDRDQRERRRDDGQTNLVCRFERGIERPLAHLEVATPAGG